MLVLGRILKGQRCCLSPRGTTEAGNLAFQSVDRLERRGWDQETRQKQAWDTFEENNVLVLI